VAFCGVYQEKPASASTVAFCGVYQEKTKISFNCGACGVSARDFILKNRF